MAVLGVDELKGMKVKARKVKKDRPLEKTVTNAILKRLNRLGGCVAKKYHSSAFGRDLDIYGCYRGMAFFIEVKRDAIALRDDVSDLQVRDIVKWGEVGAATGAACEVETAVRLVLERYVEFMEEIRNGKWERISAVAHGGEEGKAKKGAKKDGEGARGDDGGKAVDSGRKVRRSSVGKNA
jgi:hypothetical protein